jgi:hypothetical protein
MVYSRSIRTRIVSGFATLKRKSKDRDGRSVISLPFPFLFLSVHQEKNLVGSSIGIKEEEKKKNRTNGD